MDNSIKTLNPALGNGLASPVEKLRNGQTPGAAPSKSGEAKSGFADVLGERIGAVAPKTGVPNTELKFSAHAKSRLNSRGIELTAEDILKMQEAVNKADQRGSKESLILTDKAAFVVSVKNHTVITAVDRDSLKENVFTNIDSTVMI